MVVLHLIGSAEIRTGASVITPSQEIAFAAGLYLSLAGGKPVSRTRLASILWPEATESVRSHRLRQTILQLKKLGFPLRADRNVVHLRNDDIQNHPVPSIRLQEGDEPLDFLPGYGPSFSAPFRDWVDTVRDEFHSASVALLVQNIADARLRGDWQQVDKIAARCLALDAFNEEAVLARAEAAAMRGSKRRAVAILDAYISEIGSGGAELKLPANVLRRRVLERIPDRPAILNVDPPFVGREREISILCLALERARLGNGSAVMLLGEPGIGKTRLSAEVARFAELRGARVERTVCRRGDIDRPLSLFVDIVPQLREMPGALGCSPETFSWLKRLTEFNQHAESTSRGVDTEMLFESVRTALFDLLESITEENCLVIVIEDLQWLDKASAQLLVRMVEWSEQRRILFVLNARPGHDTFLQYLEKVPLEMIPLGPLEIAPSMALLKSVSLRPADEPEPSFVNWCLEVAEGNPFFLQELARHWIETGHRYEAPPSVNKVLQERLSRLSSEALQVLQACAVMSDYATLNRVERVLKYPPHQLLAAIEELSRAAMLAVTPENREVAQDRIQPRHDFLSSAAIARLSPISLAFLHRRSAEVLETDLAGESVSATLLWACATHRHEAGDRSKALALRMSCAAHLLELGLAHDAAAAGQTTLEYCVTDSERLRVSSQLAHAYEMDGAWKQSIDTLQVCMALAFKIEPAQSLHNDYELLMLDARHRSALDFRSILDESLGCVNNEQASHRHRVGAAVLAMKVSVDFGRADYLDAIFEQVSPLLESSDVRALNALEVRTIHRTMRGDGSVPIEDLKRLTEVARESDGELAYSRALQMAATACRLSARYQGGLEFIEHALQHARENRFHSRRRELILSAIALHLAAGAFEEARHSLTEVAQYPFPSDSPKERNEIHLLEARLAFEEGDFAKAAQAFQEAGAVSPTYSLSRKGYCLALEVQIRLKEGITTEELRPLVKELEATHLQTRQIGAEDFEVNSLYLGLCALNERGAAISVVRDYVNQRRVKWPLPKDFVEALATMVDSRPAGGQRVGDALLRPTISRDGLRPKAVQ